MKEEFERTVQLVGEKAFEKIQSASVLLFGIGGVGGHICESLIRCGVQKITVVDGDIVSKSNINRQILALHSTIGKNKVDVCKERMLDINPNAKIESKNIFLTKENFDQISFDGFDFIIDAIDTVTVKLLIVEKSKSKNIPAISCMGTGNKIHPELFQICDISKTSVCPLAKVMRKELKDRNISNLPVLFSTEKPISQNEKSEQRKIPPASISTTPSIAGLLISNFVIAQIINLN